MVAAMEAVVVDRDRFRDVVGGERDRFEEILVDRIPGAAISGSSADRLPHFSHVSVPGRTAETLLIRLDGAGISAAAGSACQSGAVEPSHVLTAMGMDPDQAKSCVRFSFGWNTSPGDGEAAARAVVDVIGGT
jgi:cysteine desulfurase